MDEDTDRVESESEDETESSFNGEEEEEESEDVMTKSLPHAGEMSVEGRPGQEEVSESVGEGSNVNSTNGRSSIDSSSREQSSAFDINASKTLSDSVMQKHLKRNFKRPDNPRHESPAAGRGEVEAGTSSTGNHNSSSSSSSSEEESTFDLNKSVKLSQSIIDKHKKFKRPAKPRHSVGPRKSTEVDSSSSSSSESYESFDINAPPSERMMDGVRRKMGENRGLYKPRVRRSAQQASPGEGSRDCSVSAQDEAGTEKVDRLASLSRREPEVGFPVATRQAVPSPAPTVVIESPNSGNSSVLESGQQHAVVAGSSYSSHLLPTPSRPKDETQRENKTASLFSKPSSQDDESEGSGEADPLGTNSEDQNHSKSHISGTTSSGDQVRLPGQVINDNSSQIVDETIESENSLLAADSDDDIPVPYTVSQNPSVEQGSFNFESTGVAAAENNVSGELSPRSEMSSSGPSEIQRTATEFLSSLELAVRNSRNIQYYEIRTENPALLLQPLEMRYRAMKSSQIQPRIVIPSDERQCADATRTAVQSCNQPVDQKQAEGSSDEEIPATGTSSQIERRGFTRKRGTLRVKSNSVLKKHPSEIYSGIGSYIQKTNSQISGSQGSSQRSSNSVPSSFVPELAATIHSEEESEAQELPVCSNKEPATEETNFMTNRNINEEPFEAGQRTLDSAGSIIPSVDKTRTERFLSIPENSPPVSDSSVERISNNVLEAEAQHFASSNRSFGNKDLPKDLSSSSEDVSLSRRASKPSPPLSVKTPSVDSDSNLDGDEDLSDEVPAKTVITKGRKSSNKTHTVAIPSSEDQEPVSELQNVEVEVELNHTESKRESVVERELHSEQAVANNSVDSRSQIIETPQRKVSRPQNSSRISFEDIPEELLSTAETHSIRETPQRRISGPRKSSKISFEEVLDEQHSSSEAHSTVHGTSQQNINVVRKSSAISIDEAQGLGRSPVSSASSNEERQLEGVRSEVSALGERTRMNDLSVAGATVKRSSSSSHASFVASKKKLSQPPSSQSRARTSRSQTSDKRKSGRSPQSSGSDLSPEEDLVEKVNTPQELGRSSVSCASSSEERQLEGVSSSVSAVGERTRLNDLSVAAATEKRSSPSKRASFVASKKKVSQHASSRSVTTRASTSRSQTSGKRKSGRSPQSSDSDLSHEEDLVSSRKGTSKFKKSSSKRGRMSESVDVNRSEADTAEKSTTVADLRLKSRVSKKMSTLQRQSTTVPNSRQGSEVNVESIQRIGASPGMDGREGTGESDVAMAEEVQPQGDKSASRKRKLTPGLEEKRKLDTQDAETVRPSTSAMPEARSVPPALLKKGPTTRKKKDFEYYRSNADIVKTEHVMAGLHYIGVPLSKSRVEKLTMFISQQLEEMLDELMGSTTKDRENGIFTYRELELALKRRGLLDPELGKNALMIIMANVWDTTQYSKAKGVLLPKTGSYNT